MGDFRCRQISNFLFIFHQSFVLNSAADVLQQCFTNLAKKTSKRISRRQNINIESKKTKSILSFFGFERHF